MFQTFDTPSDPSQGPMRLAQLRDVLRTEALDGFIVPRADAHQGEYVAARDARLAWLTGFTGSAGFCAALMDCAGVFVDGRYRVQVKQQVDSCFSPVDWPETDLSDWLLAQLPQGGKIGFDPWLHTIAELQKLRDKLGNRIELVAISHNLIDRIWGDQPPLPNRAVSAYPAEYAGESATSKRARCGAELAQADHDSVFLSQTDSIAWLLNIRGGDIPRVPVALCFAVLHKTGAVQLFIEPSATADLTLDAGITVTAPAKMVAGLSRLSGVVRVDPTSCPSAVESVLRDAGCSLSYGTDPCVLPKACKNSVEIAGTTAAHLRDAGAMCEFLAWLDAQPADTLSEIDVVRALEGFRQATGALQDISFDTICGTGPNGAIIHYRVTEDSNRRIKSGDLLLIDSGGQYLDGTTDITRTVAIGTVGKAEKSSFTRVLQGMIAMSRIRWPAGLSGRDLDLVARLPLWMAGQDYPHGTGHGVGCFLSVHEGPQRLSRASGQVLKPGMILSNEPGFYKEDAFGIRIENLILVCEAARLPNQTVSDMLNFQTLTWVPIDRRLIETDLLSSQERAWLNIYHQTCYQRVSAELSSAARQWMQAACAEI